MSITTVFTNNRSQAVRLPADVRLMQVTANLVFMLAALAACAAAVMWAARLPVFAIKAIRIEGDVAHVRSYTSEVAVMQAGTELRPRGQYDDVVVKQGGRWLFQRRSFQALHGE